MESISTNIITHGDFKMEESSPFFTIGIPVYNRIDFTRKAVQSVLNQTYEDFELVIVDDKSTDGTWEYLNTINDRRVRLFQNDVNIGLLPNFKRCIQEARGKWFKFLMNDDYLVSDALEYLKDIIIKEGEDSTYIGKGDLLQETDGIKKTSQIIKDKYPIIKHSTRSILNDRKKFKYGNIPAMPDSYTLLTSDLKKMLETEEYLKIERNYGKTGHCVDYFIYYFNAKKHKNIIEITKPLYTIRIHENNAHKKYIDDFEYHIKGDIFVNEQIFSYRQKIDFNILRHMFLIFIDKNKRKKSIHYLGETSHKFIKIIKEIRN
jgi:glycosyltransferase involved in cell wall biosynthesis